MRSLILATLVPLAACGSVSADSPGAPASGTGTSRSWAVDGFTKVELAGPDHVDVRVGPAFAVRAEGDAEVLDRLKIERVGDRLRIERRRTAGVSLNRPEATVHVSMPAIVAAALAGSGDLTVDRAQGDAFRATLAGAGDMLVGTLAVRRTDLSVAGSGNIAAAGQGGALTVRIAGSGNVEGASLAATGADVSITGSGSMKAAVDGAATVKLAGSGDVDLGPKARCTTRKMGSGAVRCG